LLLVQRYGITGFPGNTFENDKKKRILVIISKKRASRGDPTRNLSGDVNVTMFFDFFWSQGDKE
jgi:hypothetical protein